MAFRALRRALLAASLLLAPSLGCATGEPLTAQDGSEIRTPTNPRQAMRALDRFLAPEDIAKIRSGEFTIVDMHFGLGMTLRNHWGLWRGSPLAQWFRVRGVFHPDDMSSSLLVLYTRHVRGEALDLRALVAQERAAGKRWKAEIRAEEKAERKAKRAERPEGKRRAARVEAARMGWTLAPSSPSRLVSLREGYGPISPVRLLSFDGGAIALTRASYRDGRPPEAPWIDAAYFIAAPEGELRPITTGDAVLHDVLDVAGSTWFLLRRGEGWLLLEHGDDSLTTHELAAEAAALRLIDGGEGPLLGDGRRLLRVVDGDGIEPMIERDQPWFPFEMARTPRLLGDRLYAVESNDLRCIELGDLSRCDPLEPAFFGRPVHIGGLVRADDGGLWISAGGGCRASLFHFDAANEIGIAVFDGRLDVEPEYHDGRVVWDRFDPEQLVLQIPASVVAQWRDALYMVGDVGVAKVVDGQFEKQVEKLAWVDIPEDRLGGIGWFGSTELVVFGDPTKQVEPDGLLLADPGIQVVTRLDEAYLQVRLPEVGEPIELDDLLGPVSGERD